MKKTLTWKTETRKVSELVPADYNPRTLTEKQRQDLMESIQEFGAVVPIVVNIGSRKGIIIGGHQRTSAYADLGIEEVAVQVPSRELTEEEEKRLNLRLNKNTGGWDIEKLAEMDLTMLLDVGFGEVELGSLFDNMEIIDERVRNPIPGKDPEAVIIAPGEVYQMGRHKITTGPKQGIEDLMGKDRAVLVHVTPSIKDKTGDQNELLTFIKPFMAPSAHIFWWTREEQIPAIGSILANAKINFQNVLMWIRAETENTKTAWNKCYEPCVYGSQGKPYVNPEQKGLNQIMNQGVGTGARVPDDIFETLNLSITERDFSEDKKPVSLHEKAIKRCTKPGDILLDTHGGTGSFMLAAEILGRNARIHEEDPQKASNIIRRWELYTGKKAKKI